MHLGLTYMFHDLISKVKVTRGHRNLQRPITLLLLAIKTRALAQNERIEIVYNFASYIFQVSLTCAELG